MLLEEAHGLRLQCRKVYRGLPALYLVEVKRPGRFVLADKVDFVLPLSVPPSAHARVALLLRKLPFEVPFKGTSRENVEIFGHKRLKARGDRPLGTLVKQAFDDGILLTPF